MKGLLYTPLFCEENIWQLLKRLLTEGIPAETLQVIFISNPQKQVVLFNQRSGADLGHVVWDYHVIMWCKDEAGDRIYDFDSLLPFPCDCSDYMAATFGLQAELVEPLRATLRLIPATEYLHRFYSDRHHMRGVVDEAAFPPWPAITPPEPQRIRLDQYWEMAWQGDSASRVLDVAAFLESEL